MRLAAGGGAKPLSILTTVTPDAHELSIPSKAAIPPNETPYPTLVGTAITGTDTSPPTTLGSAPSIPATTMTTAALRSSSVWVRMRWMPATPTSVSRATRLRSARAVTAASSATGRSLVPAVTIRIVPRPVGSGSGSGGRYTVRPSSPTSARGNRTARRREARRPVPLHRASPLRQHRSPPTPDAGARGSHLVPGQDRRAGRGDRGAARRRVRQLPRDAGRAAASRRAGGPVSPGRSGGAGSHGVPATRARARADGAGHDSDRHRGHERPAGRRGSGRSRPGAASSRRPAHRRRRGRHPSHPDPDRAAAQRRRGHRGCRDGRRAPERGGGTGVGSRDRRPHERGIRGLVRRDRRLTGVAQFVRVGRHRAQYQQRLRPPPRRQPHQSLMKLPPAGVWVGRGLAALGLIAVVRAVAASEVWALVAALGGFVAATGLALGPIVRAWLVDQPVTVPSDFEHALDLLRRAHGAAAGWAVGLAAGDLEVGGASDLDRAVRERGAALVQLASADGRAHVARERAGTFVAVGDFPFGAGLLLPQGDARPAETAAVADELRRLVASMRLAQAHEPGEQPGELVSRQLAALAGGALTLEGIAKAGVELAHQVAQRGAAIVLPAGGAVPPDGRAR